MNMDVSPKSANYTYTELLSKYFTQLSKSDKTEGAIERCSVTIVAPNFPKYRVVTYMFGKILA